MTHRFVSIDAASKSGKTGGVLWRDGQPILSFDMRAIGAKGKVGIYQYNPDGSPDLTQVFETSPVLGLESMPHTSLVGSPWLRACAYAALGGDVIVEEPHGKFRGADAPLAKMRGYIEAVCDLYSRDYKEISHSTWQRAVAETYPPIVWPQGGKDAKAKTIAICRDLAWEKWQFRVDSDRAEAFMVGVAAIVTKMVPVPAGWVPMCVKARGEST